MDRQLVFPGQIPLETDLLKTNRAVMIALGKLAGAVLGSSTVVNGLACNATSPASMNVQVGPGEIYSSANVDGTAYSSLAADTTHQVVKQGILMDAVTLSCPAPSTAGYSVNYLIEAAFQEVDTNAVTLPYYNASNPTQAYSGPNNSGASQATTRQGALVLQAKAGIAATTGTQTTPAADSGFVGLWVVTVAYGQISIVAGNIAAYSGAPFIGTSLPQKASVSDIGKVVDSVAAVQALDVTKFTRAFALGFSGDSDGGGGHYWYDPTDNGSTINGATILGSNTGAGRWKLALTGPVSVKQFGAKGDYNGSTGTDDTAAIQACINWVQANTNTGTYGSYSPSVGTGVVYFPQGSYKVTAALVVSTKVCIQGEGQTEFSYGSRLTQVSANTDLFQIAPGAGSTSFSVENMVLRSNAGPGTGHLVNMVRSGGGTVNSQRYVKCTFSQPQSMALYTAGDDILIENCLLDVSSQSGNCFQFGTATMPASNVRIMGGDYFNATNSIIKLVNVAGLTINGVTMTQPNGTTKTPYFVDGLTTTPTLAQSITITGCTIRGPRTFVGITGAVNLTISGNTVTEGGIGTGETFHMLSFGGTCVNVAITGNTLRGSYDTKNFYNDYNCTSIAGVISSNNFQNDGGAGDALSCSKFVGRLLPNSYSGFSSRQMGEKRATSGAAVNPGAIAAGATFGFALSVTGATYGDTVNVGTISNAWLAQTGVDVRAFINAANTVRVEYRNVTSSSITVAAHDIWAEVTR